MSTGPQKIEWKEQKANIVHFYLFPRNLIQPGKGFNRDANVKDSWLIMYSILHSELLVESKIFCALLFKSSCQTV